MNFPSPLAEEDIARHSAETRLLSRAIVYNDVSALTPETAEIYRKLLDLGQILREENIAIYTQFEDKIRTTAHSDGTRAKARLLRIFDELISKVATEPSWRAVVNIINCIHLVKRVSYYDPRYKDLGWLRAKMIVRLEQTLLIDYQRFIIEMGGWSDFVDYYEAVTRNKSNNTTKIQSTWKPILHVIGVSATVLAGLSLIINRLVKSSK